MVGASPFVGDLIYSLGLLTIAFATIAAIYTHGVRRAFWVGFVICFAGYFGHTVWPSELRSTWLGFRQMGQLDYPAPDVITSRTFSYLYQGIYDSARNNSRNFRPVPIGVNGQSIGQYLAFVTVGHTAIAFLLGIVGGKLAQRFAAEPLAQLKRSIENLGA
jgi:hypothetical protein